jgi:hypothetical protein
MKICSHCGAPLLGDERFCTKCGADTMATAGTVPAVAVPMPPQGMAGMPMQYAMPPGAVPIAMPMPPPAKRSGLMWAVIVIAVLAFGYYYHEKQKPAAQTQPGNSPSQPGGNPGVNPAQPRSGQGLVQQQVFGGRWVASYGFVEVTNARWANNSNATIQSVTLECDQYAANGSTLAQVRNILNGPVQPGASATFGPFQMGKIAPYLSKVNCGIVQVSPAS